MNVSGKCGPCSVLPSSYCQCINAIFVQYPFDEREIQLSLEQTETSRRQVLSPLRFRMILSFPCFFQISLTLNFFYILFQW